MYWEILRKELMQFNEMSVIVRMLLAMFLGGLIGSEREKSKRPAGFRTHILVCVGSCMTALVGLLVWKEMGEVTDPVRISAQVISGIGFLGVGTILVKEHDHITGLTTAAGLWTTATIGIACGYGFYLVAVTGAFVVAITSAILFKLESRSRKRSCVRSIYLEVDGTEVMNEYTDWFLKELKAKNILISPPRSALEGKIGVEVILAFSEPEEVAGILEKIREKEKVIFAIENIRKDMLRS